LTGFLFFIKQESSNYPARCFNHGYEIPKQALEIFSQLALEIFNPPPLAGLFDLQILMRFTFKI
jgi:hypothetical protein